MWNSLTVAYVTLAIVATVLVAVGAIAGARLAWRWPDGAPPGEDRDDFDRRHHLVVTLVWVGTVSLIVLAPLWFMALDSLVPAVEGGMCMASVHNLASPTSWMASSLKAIVPALLVYWIVVDRADRRRDDERLLHHKLTLLVPVALATGVSLLFDLQFFGSLDLGPSPCCMTLFDGPGESGPAGLSGWGWTWAFGGSAGLLMAASASRGRAAEPARKSVWVLAPLVAVSLVFALHTELGSAIMGFSHHCIFCVWQNRPASFAATVLVLLGAWLMLARAALAGALRAHAAEPGPARLGAPALILAAGVLLLAALAALTEAGVLR